jgi:hypothetical protein
MKIDALPGSADEHPLAWQARTGQRAGQVRRRTGGV